MGIPFDRAFRYFMLAPSLAAFAVAPSAAPAADCAGWPDPTHCARSADALDEARTAVSDIARHKALVGAAFHLRACGDIEGAEAALGAAERLLAAANLTETESYGPRGLQGLIGRVVREGPACAGRETRSD